MRCFVSILALLFSSVAARGSSNRIPDTLQVCSSEPSVALTRAGAIVVFVDSSTSVDLNLNDAFVPYGAGPAGPVVAIASSDNRAASCDGNALAAADDGALVIWVVEDLAGERLMAQRLDERGHPMGAPVTASQRARQGYGSYHTALVRAGDHFLALWPSLGVMKWLLLTSDGHAMSEVHSLALPGTTDLAPRAAWNGTAFGVLAVKPADFATFLLLDGNGDLVRGPSADTGAEDIASDGHHFLLASFLASWDVDENGTVGDPVHLCDTRFTDCTFQKLEVDGSRLIWDGHSYLLTRIELVGGISFVTFYLEVTRVMPGVASTAPLLVSIGSAWGHVSVDIRNGTIAMLYREEEGVDPDGECLRVDLYEAGHRRAVRR